MFPATGSLIWTALPLETFRPIDVATTVTCLSLLELLEADLRDIAGARPEIALETSDMSLVRTIFMYTTTRGGRCCERYSMVCLE